MEAAPGKDNRPGPSCRKTREAHSWASRGLQMPELGPRDFHIWKRRARAPQVTVWGHLEGNRHLGEMQPTHLLPQPRQAHKSRHPLPQLRWAPRHHHHFCCPRGVEAQRVPEPSRPAPRVACFSPLHGIFQNRVVPAGGWESAARNSPGLRPLYAVAWGFQVTHPGAAFSAAAAVPCAVGTQTCCRRRPCRGCSGRGLGLRSLQTGMGMVTGAKAQGWGA